MTPSEGSEGGVRNKVATLGVDMSLEEEDIHWDWGLVKEVGRLASRYRLLTAAAIGAGLLAAGWEAVSIAFLVPFLSALGFGGNPPDLGPMSNVVPSLEGLSAVEQLRWLAVGLLLLQGFRTAFTYLSNRWSYDLWSKLEADLRHDVLGQMLAVNLGVLHEDRAGRLLEIQHEHSKMASQVVHTVVKASKSASMLVVYTGYLFLLSWQLALAAIVLGGVVSLAAGPLNVKIRRYGDRQIDVLTRLNQLALEILGGMRTIRLFGRGEWASDNYRREVDEYREVRRDAGVLRAMTQPLYQFTAMVAVAGLVVISTVIFPAGAINGILLATFLFVLFRAMGPAGALNQARAKAASSLPGLVSVLSILRLDESRFLTEGSRKLEGPLGPIEFESVSFRYSPDRPFALRNVDLRIEEGETVAIVGASGAGKSTLVNLLARLYDPTSGRLVVQGRDLREYTIDSWRNRLAGVSQDTFLFNDTIRENIRFGRLDATDEEIEDAAKKANALGFIEEFSNGFETSVGDRGVKLSGGQAQRVAIARAILADPELLILDEATSDLDTITEREVQEALERLQTGRTVVVIAHRLSTVRDANRIVVLEEGEVVEIGTHEELMEKGEAYWEYARLQQLNTDGQPELAPTGGNGRPAEDVDPRQSSDTG